MKLTCGSSAHGARRVVLLAPNATEVAGHPFFPLSDTRYTSLLTGMQRLRGRIYLEDGAITPARLTADGRHVQEADYVGWHLLLVEDDETVCGCARYLSHASNVAFSRLGVSHCPLALSDRWGLRFQRAVEDEIARAWRLGVSYVEVGGWALKEDLRYSADALRIAMSSYALAFMLGGCLGISTVTYRHCSAAILKRLGGQKLVYQGEELPSYFDPTYGCEMEVLRFDSQKLGARYLPMARDMGARLAAAPVLCPPSQSAAQDLVRVAAAVGMGMPSISPVVWEESTR